MCITMHGKGNVKHGRNKQGVEVEVVEVRTLPCHLGVRFSCIALPRVIVHSMHVYSYMHSYKAVCVRCWVPRLWGQPGTA